MKPVDVDAAGVVRDNDGRVIQDDEKAMAWLERSIANWIAKAREAKQKAHDGIDPKFHTYQIGVRVGLARETNWHLLELKRHRRKVGYQASLL